MFRRLSVQILKHYRFKALCTRSFDTITVPNQMPGTSGSKTKVLGFIGCGNMGSVLIGNMISKGYKPICYDKKTKRREKVKALGATVVESLAEVASKCDIIFTLLPDYKALTDVMESKHGVIEKAKKGSIIVDMSTIGPVNAMRMQLAMEGTETLLLSAPVSGGTRFDLKNSIIFLVGGKKSILAQVEPYLNSMALKGKDDVVFHIGEHIGDGQSARLCNLLLLGCCMVGTTEVMNLGIKLGLDPKLLSTVMNKTSAQCWACEHYNPVPGVQGNAPSSHNYEDGQPVIVFLKSMSVAQDVAARIYAPIPVSALACQVFALALVRGYADQDFSAIYKIYKQTIVRQV